MPKKPKLEKLGITEEVAEDIQALFQLPDLSAAVQSILRGWLSLRRYIAKRGGRKPLSRFESITEEEFTYLQRLLAQFEKEFANNPEFSQAVVLASTKGATYDRTFFRSIRLYGASRGYSILYPWHLFVEVRHNDDTALLESVIHNLLRYSSLRNLPNFIDLFMESRISTPAKRSLLAINYLQALTNPFFATSKHQFPSQADLVQILGCSEKAIARIEKVSWYLNVVNPQYLVNMGKLGFQGFRVIHEESLPAALQPFTLRTYPLYRQEFASILYLPVTSDLMELLPQDKVYELDCYQISYNLEQLHVKPEGSWHQPMRLLAEEKKAIAPPPGGICFNLEPLTIPSPRPLIDFEIIDQVQLVASGYYKPLADSLEISEVYLVNRVQELLHDKIIAPFYFITRIGLTTSMLLAYEGTTAETVGFRNNLLAFPYVELFSGPEGGIAIVKLPPAWTGSFLKDVAYLRQKGFDMWAVLSSPVLSRWGIPLAQLARKEEFFGILWDAKDLGVSTT